MNARLYRLLETLQRIDQDLRREQQRHRPDWVTLLRLERLKLRAKQLIHRFTLRPERI